MGLFFRGEGEIGVRRAGAVCYMRYTVRAVGRGSGGHTAAERRRYERREHKWGRETGERRAKSGRGKGGGLAKWELLEIVVCEKVRAPGVERRLEQTKSNFGVG